MIETVTRLRSAGFDVWCSPDYSIVLCHGDCLQVLPLLEPGSVDCVLTDPPYGINFTQRTTGAKITGDDSPFDVSRWLALEVPSLFWGAHEFYSNLPAGGSWYVWNKRAVDMDDAPLKTYGDAEFAWSNVPGPVRCLRHISDGCVKQGEESGIVRLHPSQKPVRLMRWCLRFIKGDIVFDPYMGVATVPVACIRTGRRCLAIEIEPQTPTSPDYFGIAVRRVQAELNRHPLFEPPPKRQKELI